MLHDTEHSPRHSTAQRAPDEQKTLELAPTSTEQMESAAQSTLQESPQAPPHSLSDSQLSEQLFPSHPLPARLQRLPLAHSQEAPTQDTLVALLAPPPPSPALSPQALTLAAASATNASARLSPTRAPDAARVPGHR